ncbi:hypothetical protein AYO44_00470 [Planctomycetaceae bacterium SCGC AG-212-F19]|nr:hypothetical protein AYO44_00470 [Planctomycetaceae bacterium SCGC AG-212-F19]
MHSADFPSSHRWPFDRRSFLRFGGVNLLSAGLLHVLAARSQAALSATGAPAAKPRKAKARACIILFQTGGPYQVETFDPKPGAPADVRGVFQTQATRVPGLNVTDALGDVAKHADKFAVVRSVNHTIRCHNPAIYCTLVGREATEALAVSNKTTAKRTDHPHYASVVARLRPGVPSMPAHVILPDVTNNGPAKSPGLLGGYLGANYDPFVLGADPNAPDFRVASMGLPGDVDAGRFQDRQDLRQQLDGQQRLLEKSGAAETMGVFYQRAFSLLTSPRSKEAFDLSREPPKVRDRYGRHTQGQSCLLARRLVEAGVPFVSVFSHTDVDKGSWDTHNNHNERCKKDLMPPANQCFSALLEDLAARGLLDDVLVVWMGEFGRTPRMGVNFSNNSNNVGGRDHWCNCYSVVLAGGGVRGGQVIGSSDWIGGYPKDRPVHISDIAATIYHALGVDPRTELYDFQGQLRFICDGNPVAELF